MTTTLVGAQRIVSLLPTATEILYGLGLGPRVVGVSHECDFPPAAAAKPRLTVSHVDAAADSLTIDQQVRQRIEQGEPLYGINQALLEQLQPDLVVTQAQCDVCAVRYDDVVKAVSSQPSAFSGQQSGGVEVLALNPASLADILADIIRVGEAAGVIDAAEAYVGDLCRRSDAVRAVVSAERALADKSETRRGGQPVAPRRGADIPVCQVTEKALADKQPVAPDAHKNLMTPNTPRVAVIEWINPLMLAGNWTPELVAIAGGDCGNLVRAGAHSTYTDWDQVRRFDPEVLVVAPCGFDLRRTLAESQTLPRLPGWSEIKAVGDDRVWAVDGNVHFNRPGPRLVDTLELLAHLLHPERVPAPAATDPQGWRQL